jgi:hypothetical protein
MPKVLVAEEVGAGVMLTARKDAPKEKLVLTI